MGFGTNQRLTCRRRGEMVALTSLVVAVLLHVCAGFSGGGKAFLRQRTPARKSVEGMGISGKKWNSRRMELANTNTNKNINANRNTNANTRTCTLCASSSGPDAKASVLSLGARRSMTGEARVPGSKSISNRVILLAALADGPTRLSGVLDSDDVRVLKDALTKLGIRIDISTEGQVSDSLHVYGRGSVLGKRAEAGEEAREETRLYMGNAGTAMRSMCAALCTGRGKFILEGNERMHQRPISDLVNSLRACGFRIDYLHNDGCPPLRIHGAAGTESGTEDETKTETEVLVDGSISSQYVSAMIMAAPLFPNPGATTINIVGGLTSAPYVDMTISVVRRFGVEVERPDENTIRIASKGYKSPTHFQVEPDASSASYFLAGGALGCGPVTVRGLENGQCIQGDAAFVEVLRGMGASVQWKGDVISVSEPEDGVLHGIDMDLNHIPDAAMTAAVLALFASNDTIIRGIGSWRVKECDRLDAMATELRKFGARVNTGQDWIRISPPTLPLQAHVEQPVRIHTYNDHRIAMALSLACLGPHGIALEIENPGCVAKTFPEYFQEFERLTA